MDQPRITTIKAGFAYWGDRIAPVFDTARFICVVEVQGARIVRQTQHVLADEDVSIQRALRLLELGIGSLICGAISRPMYQMLRAYGINVIPFVCGELKQVVHAWLEQNLDRNDFCMPGCCRRRWCSSHTQKWLWHGRKGSGQLQPPQGSP